jgi:hypothetical protein
MDETAPAFPEYAPRMEESAPERVSTPERVSVEEGLTDENQPSPVAPLAPAPSTARMRGRRTLPASPVERARLEAQAGEPPSEINDRTTQVAFALLFIVPLLIILLSILLFLPFINSQLTEDPSGVQVQRSANGQSPAR